MEDTNLRIGSAYSLVAGGRSCLVSVGVFLARSAHLVFRGVLEFPVCLVAC